MKSRTRQTLLLVILGVVLLSSVFQLAQSAATISTDRKTYSVGAQITITGAGFAPGAYIYVKVERPDHVVDAIAPNPLSNASGGFTVVYTPPLISGRYKISATDGTSTTTAAATEADAVGFNKAGYVKNQFTPEDQTGNWSSGNQGQKYTENQWTFDQYEVDGIASAADVPSFDVSFNHYESSSNAVFIDALANFRACVDCQAADGADAASGMLDDTHPLPPNANANWKVLTVGPGQIISNVNRPLNTKADGSGSQVLSGSKGFCSSNTPDPINTPAETHCFHVDGTKLAALFTSQLNDSSKTHTVTLSFNGHLAASYVWGNGQAGIGGHEASVGDCTTIYWARPYDSSVATEHSAFEPPNNPATACTPDIAIYGTDNYAGWTTAFHGVGFASGSSRHWSMDNQSSGPKGSIDIPIPTVAAPSNTIIVKKVTSPANATATFNFTSGVFGGFSLSNPFPSSKTFTGIAAGVQYDVTESALAGWTFNNVDCQVTGGTDVGGTWPTNSSSATALITLGANDNGVTLTCTYTNTGAGHIIVHKVTNPSSDTSTSFSYTTGGSGYNGFSLVGGGQNDSGPLSPGNYTVSESALAGWDLANLTCDTQTGVTINGAQASISLAAGQTVNCTYTNTKRSHIVVKKHTNPSPNPFDASFAFTTTGTGYTSFSLKDTQTNTDGANPPTNGLTPGTYTISEGKLSDWILSNVSCVSASGSSTVPSPGTSQPTSITLAAGDTVTCDYTNNWPDANVTLSPSAVNEVGHQHVFTITVNAVTDGLGTPTFKSITPSVTPTAGLTTNTNTCATPTLSNGGLTATCTLTINSSTPGVYTAHVDAVVTIGGVDFARSTGDGKGSVAQDGPDTTKTYVNAKIVLSPLDATNGITQAHTITATVSQDKGDGAGFVAAPNGTLVTFSLLNNTAGATFVAGNTCTTTGGTCTIQINSTSPGGVDVHATTDVNVLGTTVTRASGDGLSGDSANAHKKYVASHIVVIKNTQPSPNPFDANFHFTTTGTGYTSFNLKDSASNSGVKNTDGGSAPAAGLAPGDYTVSEDSLSNWILHSRTCSITSTDGSGTSTFSPNGNTPSATIHLGMGDTVTCVYTNDWPDGFVSITPLTAKNEVGTPHTFTVTVTALPDGASPVVFTSITPSVSPTPNLQNTNTCASPTIDLSNPSLPKATCTVTINSSTAGNFTVHVAAVITIEGVAINRATGDGLGLPSTDSADAVKTYIAPSTTLVTKTAPTSLLTGATATVVVTETNTGSGALTNVNVSGGGACASFTPASVASLAAGASQDFTCTFTVAAGANGWFADGHGTDELGNAAPIANEHTSGSVRGVSPSTTLVTKSAPTSLEAGTTANIVVTETNTGNGALTNVSVSGGGKCASFSPASIASLAAGASQDFACSFTVTAGDTNGWFADGHGTDELGNAAPIANEHTSGAVHGVAPSTSLTLKSSPSSLIVGQTATIVVTETNTGNSTLTNVSVSGGGKCASFTGGLTTLTAGASTDYTCTFTVVAGTNSWFADGHGTDELGNAAPIANEHQSGSVTGLVLPTLTILKSTRGGAANFGWTVTGANPMTPGANVPANSSNFQVFTGNINVGTNTISENAPPSGWTLTDVSCTGYSGTNAGTPADGPGPNDTNGVPSNWTFTATYGDHVVCSYVNSSSLTTRTQGFWSTHTTLANNVWSGTNLPSGATAVTGSGDEFLCTANPITAIALPGQNQLMGGFWSNISQLSVKGKRQPIDQARMQMLQQYLAAVLNVHMFGSGSEQMLLDARTAYCGNNQSAIQAQIGILGNFNQSGDSGVFSPGSSATAKDSKSQADILFWDVTFR